MPDDTITLVSTSDTPEQVQAALVGRPAKPAAEAATTPAATDDKPADTPAADAKPATSEAAIEPDIPADETAEQKETREASEAGRALSKRAQKIQAEIDTLTGKKYNARQAVEVEEARLADIRRQIQELEAKGGKPAETPATPPPAATPTAPAVASRPEPKIDAVDDKGNAKYATYEDYLSDHAVWTKDEAILATRALIDQEKTAERERIEHDSANRAVSERLATYNSNLDAFKKTHADFDAAFEDAKDAVQETLVALGPQALKVIDGYTVFDAEDGPALTYYLLKRPDELKAIAMKAPHQQLLHLARLEERIRPAGATRKAGPSATTTATKAPEPIRPVDSGPTATTVPLDEEPYQDYRARRERELRARRGL
jgi:hypothetical protein